MIAAARDFDCAAELAPGRALTEQTRCAVALRSWLRANEDADGLDRCASALAFRAPDSAPSHYYAAWAALAQEDVGLALEHERALRGTAATPQIDALRQRIYEAIPWYFRAWSRSIELLGLWALGWLLLIAATLFSSTLATRAARSVARAQQREHHARE